VPSGDPNSPDGGVFVEPVPATGEKHQAPKVRRDYHPVWAPDGKTLFYMSESTLPLVAVPITTRPSFGFGMPIELSRAPRPGLQAWQRRGYDVLPDGRFASVVVAPGPPEARVVLNWFEELKARVPTR
jgi:hypothetical protein